MKFVDFFLNVQRITETAFGLSLAIANTLLSTIDSTGWFVGHIYGRQERADQTGTRIYVQLSFALDRFLFAFFPKENIYTERR